MALDEERLTAPEKAIEADKAYSSRRNRDYLCVTAIYYLRYAVGPGAGGTAGLPERPQ